MSKHTRVSSEAQSFLSNDEIKRLALSWQDSAHELEPAGHSPADLKAKKEGVIPKQKQMDRFGEPYGGKFYQKDHWLTRLESTDPDGIGYIEYCHAESFIRDTIPRLWAQKKDKSSPLKILDVGAGVGLYADQIENSEFGPSYVEVTATGISKQAARLYRERNGLPRLKNNRLKFRSIKQLLDFPEFDLIIDTYGEALYNTDPQGQVDPAEILDIEIKKLNPRGYLSVSPYSIYMVNNGLTVGDLQKKYPIKAWTVTAFNGNQCLKIEKL